jgi:hypothetical protein
MATAPIRVYADTSVFGGVFDREYARPSRLFFERVRLGLFELVVSAVVQAEVDLAPLRVRSLLDELLPVTDRVEISKEALELRDACIQAGIVSTKWLADAMHVALATIAGCSIIVSWNFKHIVHYQKIPMYNAVNTLRGYGQLNIHSPSEVTENDQENL